MTGEQAPVAASGAVIVDDGRILLVRRSLPPEEGQWVVPSGRVEWGETWRAAAAREAFEETGLVVEVGDVAWVGEVLEADYHYAIVDFFATVTGGRLRPGSDAADARWVSFEEAADLPMPSSMHALVDRLKRKDRRH